MEEFNMDGFNMDFNMDDFPEMPSFNNMDFSNINADEMGELSDEGLQDFGDINLDRKSQQRLLRLSFRERWIELQNLRCLSEQKFDHIPVDFL